MSNVIQFPTDRSDLNEYISDECNSLIDVMLKKRHKVQPFDNDWLTDWFKMSIVACDNNVGEKLSTDDSLVEALVTAQRLLGKILRDSMWFDSPKTDFILCDTHVQAETKYPTPMTIWKFGKYIHLKSVHHIFDSPIPSDKLSESLEVNNNKPRVMFDPLAFWSYGEMGCNVSLAQLKALEEAFYLCGCVKTGGYQITKNDETVDLEFLVPVISQPNMSAVDQYVLSFPKSWADRPYDCSDVS